MSKITEKYFNKQQYRIDMVIITQEIFFLKKKSIFFVNLQWL